MATRVPTQAELQPLLNLGISRSHATKGLQSQSFRVNQAINWCLENPEVAAEPQSSSSVNESNLQNLMSMGFSEAHARNSLLLNGNHLERATNWCLTNPEIVQSEAKSTQKPKQKPAGTSNSHQQVENQGEVDEDWRAGEEPQDEKEKKRVALTAEELEELKKEAQLRAKIAEKQRKDKMRRAEIQRVKREEALEKKAQAAAEMREEKRKMREAELEAKGPEEIFKTILSAYGAAQARDTITLMVKMMDLILKNPSQQKYRKVKLGAKKIQKEIVRVAGGVAILRCAGFRDTEGGLLVLPSTSSLDTLKKIRNVIHSLVSKKTATCIPKLIQKAREQDSKKQKPSIERVYFATIELKKLFSNVVAAADEEGKVAKDFLSLSMDSLVYRYRFKSVPASIEILKEMGYKQIRGYWRVEAPDVELFVAAVKDLNVEIAKFRGVTPIFKATSKIVRANPIEGSRTMVSVLLGCLDRIISEPENVKYHKLKLSVLFRKTGILDGSRVLIGRLGFKIEDLTETAHLKLTKSGEVDLNLLQLRRDDLSYCWTAIAARKSQT